jgi:hypothetical protein
VQERTLDSFDRDIWRGQWKVSALDLPPGKIIMGNRRLRSNRHGFKLSIEPSLSSLKRDV